jgi:hypothetical protein
VPGCRSFGVALSGPGFRANIIAGPVLIGPGRAINGAIYIVDTVMFPMVSTLADVVGQRNITAANDSAAPPTSAAVVTTPQSPASPGPADVSDSSMLADIDHD